MANYFPRQTIAWKVQETPGFRRLTLSLVEMAVVTGVLLRVYRALVLAFAGDGSWVYLGGTFALGVLVLCGVATLHLGNYPIRQWTWRAPLFAAVEAAAEMVTSLLLIALHRERIGSGAASYSDWQYLATRTLLARGVIVLSFALVLAGVVQLVRWLLIRRDKRAEALRH